MTNNFVCSSMTSLFMIMSLNVRVYRSNELHTSMIIYYINNLQFFELALLHTSFIELIQGHLLKSNPYYIKLVLLFNLT